MSSNLRKCLHKMNILNETKCSKLKKSILNEMSKNDDYFNAIFEIVLNLSENKFKQKLTPSVKKKLRKHSKTLNIILSKPKSKRKRLSAVKQSGGVVQILFPIVKALLAEIFQNAVL